MIPDYTALSDEALLDLSRTDDGRAPFGELLHRHRRRCLSVAMTILRHEENAADAVQESFLKAWRHQATYRGEASFSSWLLQIVANESLQQVRRRGRRATVSLDSEPGAQYTLLDRLATECDLEEDLAEGQLLAAARRTVETMPHDYRESLELYYCRGLRTRDIAVRLDLPVSTIKSRLCRGRGELRRRIQSRLADWKSEPIIAF